MTSDIISSGSKPFAETKYSKALVLSIQGKTGTDIKSKDSSSFNNPEYYCNNSNNKKNVYDASNTVGKKSDCPCDNQDYCDDIK